MEILDSMEALIVKHKCKTSSGRQFYNIYTENDPIKVRGVQMAKGRHAPMNFL